MVQTRRRWTAAEIDQVFNRYVTEGPTKLARDLNRSENSVTSLANRFGLRSATRRQRQTVTRKRKQIDPVDVASRGLVILSYGE